MACPLGHGSLGLTHLAVQAIPTVGSSLGMRAILVGKAKWKPQKPIPHGEHGAGGTPILNIYS